MARYHGAEWIDAEVTEFRVPASPILDPPPELELLPVVPGTSLELT